MVKKLKNVPLVKVSENYRKVLAYFFSFPEQPISLNNLALQISASKTSTKSAVQTLIKQLFIKKEVWRYKEKGKEK